MDRRLGPAKPRGVAWNGAGGCSIVSQARQENFSRTVCTTFQRRGTTSSVSVTSSPSFDSFVEPQDAVRETGRNAGTDSGFASFLASFLQRNRRLGLIPCR